MLSLEQPVTIPAQAIYKMWNRTSKQKYFCLLKWNLSTLLIFLPKYIFSISMQWLYLETITITLITLNATFRFTNLGITSLAGIQIFIISGKAKQQYLPQQRGSLIQGSITIHSDLQVKLLVSMNLKIINLRQESANT